MTMTWMTVFLLVNPLGNPNLNQVQGLPNHCNHPLFLKTIRDLMVISLRQPNLDELQMQPFHDSRGDHDDLLILVNLVMPLLPLETMIYPSTLEAVHSILTLMVILVLLVNLVV
jgi:hypothetical protein